MPRSIRATRAPGIGNLMKLGKHSLGSKGCIRVLCMQSLCQRTGYYVTCSHFGKGLSIVCAVSMAEGWTLCMQSVWKRVRYCKCSHFDRGLDTVYAVSLAEGWKMCILMRSFPSLTNNQSDTVKTARWSVLSWNDWLISTSKNVRSKQSFPKIAKMKVSAVICFFGGVFSGCIICTVLSVSYPACRVYITDSAITDLYQVVPARKVWRPFWM